MFHISTDAVLWMIDLALRATLILALACLIAALLRRASAALRHVVWTAAVAALLALPAMVLALPAWRALPRWEKARPAATNALAPTPPTATSVTANALSPEAPGSAAAVSVRSDLPLPTVRPADEPSIGPSRAAPQPGKWALPAWPAWVLAVWLAGIVALLLPLGVAACALARLRHHARPCVAPLAQQILAECLHDLAIARPVTLLETPHAAPMTFGILCPHILVPTDSASWSAARWRIVLRHELAHIQRRDLLTQTLAQLTRAVYWFHPLAWFACARMAVERERACDDLAVAGADPVQYAQELFAVARAVPPAVLTWRLAAVAGVPMARLSSLEARVRAVLDVNRSRRGLTAAIVVVALLAGLAIVLPLSVLRAATNDQTPVAPAVAPATFRVSTTSSTSAPASEPAGQRVAYVLGGVGAPGAYPINSDISTVGQLMAIAHFSSADPSLAITLCRSNANGGAEKVWSKSLEQVLSVPLLDKDLYVVAQTAAPASSPAADPNLIAVQEAEVAIAKLHADDTTEIEAEKAVLAHKQADLQRLQQVLVSAQEIESAKLEVTLAQARVEIAQSKHKEAVLEYQRAQAILQAVKNGVPVASINPSGPESLNTSDHSPAEIAAMLAIAKHRADDTADLDAEKAVVAAREAELLRTKAALAVGALTQAQVDAATAEFNDAKAQAAIALSRHEEEVLKYQLLQQQLAPKAPVSAPALTLQADVVLVVGQVPNPGKYQFHPDETLAQALADAGLAHPAADQRVSLNRVNPDGKTMTAWTRPFSQAKDFLLQRNDTLQVELPATTNH